MGRETPERVQMLAGDKSDCEALSRWTNEGGAPALSENAAENGIDPIWFSFHQLPFPLSCAGRRRPRARDEAERSR
jgi:hypothetical protein